MPAATVGSQTQVASAAPASSLPFMEGTYEYSEPQTVLTQLLDANSHENVIQLTPGGFLRGVTLQVTVTTPAVGAATVNADFPFNVFSNITIESIDGTPILYPMNGYSYYLQQKFLRPWDGDPTTDPQYNAPTSGLTFQFNLRVWVEARGTLGVLPNTDARSQYRLRLTFAPTSNIYSSPPATSQATVQVAIATDTYAQPPQANQSGVPFAPLPDGLAVQREVSHEIQPTVASAMTLRSNRVGNIIRSLILVFRDASGTGGSGVRTDLVAAGNPPFRLRLDNSQLVVETYAKRIYEANRFYNLDSQQMALSPQGTNPGANPTTSNGRPTGVYVWPRWHDPGSLDGQAWLPTADATFLQWEFAGAVAGGNVEIITEDLAPVAAVPHYLMDV